VPLLNPKLANVPTAKSCELRVRGTSVSLHPAQEKRVALIEFITPAI
jgi:hypothetical protein